MNEFLLPRKTFKLFLVFVVMFVVFHFHHYQAFFELPKYANVSSLLALC